MIKAIMKSISDFRARAQGDYDSLCKQEKEILRRHADAKAALDQAEAEDAEYVKTHQFGMHSLSSDVDADNRRRLYEGRQVHADELSKLTRARDAIRSRIAVLARGLGAEEHIAKLRREHGAAIKEAEDAEKALILDGTVLADIDRDRSAVHARRGEIADRNAAARRAHSDRALEARRSGGPKPESLTLESSAAIAGELEDLDSQHRRALRDREAHVEAVKRGRTNVDKLRAQLAVALSDAAEFKLDEALLAIADIRLEADAARSVAGRGTRSETSPDEIRIAARVRELDASIPRWQPSAEGKAALAAAPQAPLTSNRSEAAA